MSCYAKKEFNKIIGQKHNTERAEGGGSYDNEEEKEGRELFTMRRKDHATVGSQRVYIKNQTKLFTLSFSIAR